MCKNPYWWAPGMDALGSQLRGWFYHPCTAVLCMSCSTHVHSASQPCYQLPCRLCQLFKFLQGNYFLTFNLDKSPCDSDAAFVILLSVISECPHKWCNLFENIWQFFPPYTMLKLSKNLGYTLPMLFVVCGEGKGICGFKKAAQMQICFKVLSMIIARDGAKLLAYCLDYDRQTYFFYLVPTNRSFLLFILIKTLWIIVFSRMGMILEKLILTWSMSKLRYVINKAGFMVRYGSGQYS